MKYRLPVQAREFVLFQRTELLPKRPTESFLRRALIRFKLLDSGYEESVRRYARTEPELIDKKYFEIMLSKANSLLPHIPKETSSILDIGCGIAALDLFLFNNLKSPNLFHPTDLAGASGQYGSKRRN